jgi:hypothetical protein
MQTGESGKESEESAGKGPEKQAKKPAGDGERQKMLRGGVIALAVLVAVIAWVASRGDDGDSGESEAAGGFEAKIVDEAELEEIASSAGHAVYWIGPVSGLQLEASESQNGDVQVRYLPKGTEAGSDSTLITTIGSYPLADAKKALEGFAGRPGAIVTESDEIDEIVSSREAPGSAYFASPDGSVQIEVYDPSPNRAMGLALSGKVKPVG